MRFHVANLMFPSIFIQPWRGLCKHITLSAQPFPTTMAWPCSRVFCSESLATSYLLKTSENWRFSPLELGSVNNNQHVFSQTMEELEKRLAAIEKAMEEEAAGGSEIQLMGLKSNKHTFMVADEWMNECPWVYDTRLMWQSLEIAMRGGIAWISGHHGHHHWKVKIWLSKKTRTGYRGAQQFLFQSRWYRTNNFTCHTLEVLHEKLAVMHKSWRTLAAYLHFCRFPLHHSHQSHFQ